MQREVISLLPDFSVPKDTSFTEYFCLQSLHKIKKIKEQGLQQMASSFCSVSFKTSREETASKD